MGAAEVSEHRGGDSEEAPGGGRQQDDPLTADAGGDRDGTVAAWEARGTAPAWIGPPGGQSPPHLQRKSPPRAHLEVLPP